MAFLIPLLLPSVIHATANIALGVTNAVQGTTSNVSVKIGNKVFTTSQPFPFERLPSEIRREIILMALELSKELLIPPIVISQTIQPFGPPIIRQEDLDIYNPLNPDNPNYRSIVGEFTQANGYPLSSWKWLRLNREWRDILRRELWRRCVIRGHLSYHHLFKMINDPKFDLFTFTHHLELHQGFEDPTALYTIMRHPQLKHLSSLSILPTYPFRSSPFEDLLPPFEFGLQLIPTPEDDRHPLKHLEIGLPLEVCTNQAQRQHLAQLKPEKLSVTMLRPTISLLEELQGLLEGMTHTIELRYLSLSTREMVNPTVFLSPPLESFDNVVLHLPRLASSFHHHPYIGQTDANTSFAQRIIDVIMSNEEMQERYTVWIEDQVEGFDITGRRKEVSLWQPPLKVEEDTSAAITETLAALDVDGSGSKNNVHAGGAGAGAGSSTKHKGKNNDDSWERETNLKLFGGLVSLRMESKKH